MIFDTLNVRKTILKHLQVITKAIKFIDENDQVDEDDEEPTQEEMKEFMIKLTKIEVSN